MPTVDKTTSMYTIYPKMSPRAPNSPHTSKTRRASSSAEFHKSDVILTDPSTPPS